MQGSGDVIVNVLLVLIDSGWVQPPLVPRPSGVRVVWVGLGVSL